MPDNNYPAESSQLIRSIKGLNFVTDAKIESMNGICTGNFNNTLIYNKDINGYVAKVNLNGHCYKINISIDGNRPSPRYEKLLKRCF